MASPRYQHTVVIPEDLEDGIAKIQAQQPEPESFNAFINRLIRQELEERCVTTMTT